MSTEVKSRAFDFRMDVSSWITILSMILLFAFMFIPMQVEHSSEAGDVLRRLGMGALATFLLISISCIPVIIYCWFAKVIPDIDYSVIVAAIICILAMASYLLM